MQRLKIPMVDAPMVALHFSSVLSTNLEGLPKDYVDQCIEMAVRKAFEAAAGLLRLL